MEDLLVTCLLKVERCQAMEGLGAVTKIQEPDCSHLQSLVLLTGRIRPRGSKQQWQELKRNLGKSTKRAQNLALEKFGGTFCFSGQQRQRLTTHGREQRLEEAKLFHFDCVLSSLSS